MRLNNLQYAYVGNDIRHIYSGNKIDNYHLDKDLIIPLVFCQGSKIKSYWRKEANIDDSVLRDFFGSSESIEHYNKKIEIHLKKELIADDCKFIANTSKVEYRLKSINKIIDVVFFDTNDKPLIGIEVFHTNKKTESDIIEFNKLNFPIYEYNIDTRECLAISAGDTDSKEIRGMQSAFSRFEQYISTNARRVESSRDPIQKLKQGVRNCSNRRKKLHKEYFEEKDKHENLKDRDEKLKDKDKRQCTYIQELRDCIREYNDCIREINRRRHN